MSDATFRCERLRCTLARDICARRWREASSTRMSACHGCAVGEQHARAALPSSGPTGGTAPTELAERRAATVLQVLEEVGGRATPAQLVEAGEGRDGLTHTMIAWRALQLLVERGQVELIRRGLYQLATVDLEEVGPVSPADLSQPYSQRRLAALEALQRSGRPLATREIAEAFLAARVPCASSEPDRREEARVAMRWLTSQGHARKVAEALWEATTGRSA